MKDEYLGDLKAAGFREVDVVDETHFPVELMVNDPTAAAIVKDMSVSTEQVQEVGDSVLSIKVRAVKTDGKA